VNAGYPYDVGNDPRLAGALVTPGEAASISATAAALRQEIYEGAYPVGTRAPSRQELADKSGLSRESAGVVLRMLAAQGLVSLQQGSGTYVLPRRRYQAEVSVFRAGKTIPAGVHKSVSAKLAAEVRAEPAVSDLELGGMPGIAPPVLLVGVTVETGGLAQAVALALDIVRKALSGDDAWDLDGTSVEARPAK
jgi:DNA-binding transcriptional regulator YhcF (GntR family)